MLLAGARGSESSSVEAGDAAGAALATAPSLELADLRSPGGTVSLVSPTRPTVVNFFAAWCGPCREEMPLLGRAAASRSDVAFVGVDVRDVRADALELLAEAKADFPVGVDGDGSVSRAYRLRGMPTTLLVAPGGRVLAHHTGPLTARSLRQLLDRLEAE